MIELTPEQRKQLDEGLAVELTDPQTATPYVLLRKDVYDRLRRLLYDDGDATAEELRGLLARSAAANGWGEPGMDAYDRYDEERRFTAPSARGSATGST